MVNFKLPGQYDLAALLMDSASYLLDNQSVYNHFECVADCLKEDGLYVLEISHPRYIFKVGEPQVTEWTMERANKKVQFQWGDNNDPFDPITQITDITVRIKYFDGTDEGKLLTRLREGALPLTNSKLLSMQVAALR